MCLWLCWDISLYPKNLLFPSKLSMNYFIWTLTFVFQNHNILNNLILKCSLLYYMCTDKVGNTVLTDTYDSYYNMIVIIKSKSFWKVLLCSSSTGLKMQNTLLTNNLPKAESVITNEVFRISYKKGPIT